MSNNTNHSQSKPSTNSYLHSFCDRLREVRVQEQNNQVFSQVSSLPTFSSSLPTLPTISDVQPSSVSTISSNPLISNPNEYINNYQRNVYSVHDKYLAKVHFLWNSGVWNTTLQSVDNFDSNLLAKPNIAIIEPNCFDNFDKINKSVVDQVKNTNQYHTSNLPIPSMSTANSLNTQNLVSHNYNYQSAPNSLNGLPLLDGFDYDETKSMDSVTISISPPILSSDFQSRSPSPSCTNSNISSTNKTKNSKKLGVFNNYVFFSNRCTSALQRKLGKSGARLEYKALYQFECRKFQYSILRGHIRIVKIYNTDNTNNPNNHTNLVNIENYLIFKFGRESVSEQLYGICEPNDKHPEKQAWCCQRIVSLTEMISFFKLDKFSLQIQNSFLSHIKIEDRIVKKVFNPNMGNNTNVVRITKMLKRGYDEYMKELQQQNLNQQLLSNHQHSRRNNKSNTIKNHDKFEYLNAVRLCLGVKFEILLGLISDSIENAFIFGHKYPETVLTQGFIDEERGTLSFELVLQAEVYHQYRLRYYKFGIPIVERIDKQTGNYYYEAKNILTPKMAADNIRVNSIGAILDNNSWIANLSDWKVSYYRKLDYKWFDNIGMIKAHQRSIINTTNIIDIGNQINNISLSAPNNSNNQNNQNSLNITNKYRVTGQLQQTTLTTTTTMINAETTQPPLLQTLPASVPMLKINYNANNTMISVGNNKDSETDDDTKVSQDFLSPQLPPIARLKDRESFEIKNDENDNNSDDDEVNVKPSGTLKRDSVEGIGF